MPQPYPYPPARKSDAGDDYHGTYVRDPYRWLEDAESAETQAFVQAQNGLTRNYLDAIPERETLVDRLRELWNYPRYTVPRKRGSGPDSRYFFTLNEGLQNQPILYVQTGLDEDPEVLLDPNQLSEEGTVALTNYAPDRPGRLLAYALSSSGSDWQEIRIREVESGQTYDDVLKWIKFTTIAWKPDSSGFYYSRYPQPGTMPDAPPSTHQRLYWHQLGRPQAEDTLVYARPDNPDLGFNPMITEDEQYLVLDIWQGTDVRNRIYYRPLGDESAEEVGDFVRLLDEADASYQFAGNVGSRFYFRTDLDAPQGRVIAIDVARPEKANWEEIVPEGEHVIDYVGIVDDHLVVITLEHAAHHVTLYTLDGSPTGEVALPAPGSIAGLSGRQQDEEMFINFQSYLYPPTIFRYDFADGQLATLHQPAVDFNPDAYETHQEFVPSPDGTRIPVFLSHRKGLERNGENPTILYGYGGFAASMLPYFSTFWITFLEAGGLLAVANLRGGNEYGETWHQAGMLGNKQNVFDDFIAVAEWLLSSGYTKRERLAIMGGSNGGLLVSAVEMQRPELFGAVVSQVPVADMLRYHRFTAGRYWIPEYGNAEENPDHFRFLYAYSPLHNVEPGTSYPPTLIVTADTDDRVVPMHAKKLAATMQAATAGPDPILLRIETAAGHGLGKPTSKIIEESADILAFLFDTLEMAPEE